MPHHQARRPPVPFGMLLLLLVVVTALALWRSCSGSGDEGIPAAAGAGAPDPVSSASVPTDPSPEASPSPRPASPESAPPAVAPTGELLVAPGQSEVVGQGPVRRFIVEVEETLPVRPASFAAKVEAILFDERSWVGAGRVALQRVTSGPVAFRVTLASPGTTDRLCAPLVTTGIFSCSMGGRAVLNHRRWSAGADSYAGDLASYRIYMVNHEVGHALGHRHRDCPGPGEPTPVMVQQTKGLYGCARNPWPLPSERG